MKKFTKEITALLASAAVGAAACAGTASASSEEQIEQTAGVLAISDEIVEEPSIEDMPTAGMIAPPDDSIEQPTEEIPPLVGEPMPTDELIDSTEEEFPPVEGEIVPPDEWIEATTEELPPLAGDVLPLDGDVDLNGSFSVSDVVMFQKWLSASSDVHLSYWQAADFNYDNKLNIFDLCLMKKALIEKNMLS